MQSRKRDRFVFVSAKKTCGRWLRQLVCAWGVVLAATGANADEIKPNIVEIPVGPGQACIKYAAYYSALVDWQGGTPAELSRYIYVSYDAVEYAHTVHSCVGGYPLYPGPLPEGKFFLLLGGLLTQAAIVNIERIDDKCPYMLTYYWLKKPVRISDSNGTCIKGEPPLPVLPNTPNSDPGKPDCPAPKFP